jgi:hypothetical protein
MKASGEGLGKLAYWLELYVGFAILAYWLGLYADGVVVAVLATLAYLVSGAAVVAHCTGFHASRFLSLAGHVE